MRGRESLLSAGIVVLGLTVVSSAWADEPYFIGLSNSEPGRSYDSVCGVSADGSTVVGFHTTFPSSDPNQAYNEACRWTLADGMRGLGHLDANPMSYSYAFAASSDGSVIVGESDNDGGSRAFVWAAESGMVELTSMPSFSGVMWSGARSISGDGSVVAGVARTLTGDYRAFRWTVADGMINLGTLGGQNPSSWATRISLDGTTIVGYTTSWEWPAGVQGAFVWTEEKGMVGLGLLSSGCSATGCQFYSYASAVSADGSVVAGLGLVSPGRDQAFRWTSETGLQLLPSSPTGYFPRTADAISADGSTIVGWASSPYGEMGYVWDEARGTRTLPEFLQNEWHLAIEGWTQLQPAGISADGLTIVGNGISPNGRTTGWVAHVPESPVPPGIFKAVSRKTHRDRGDFDIDLLHPTVGGTVPIECRVGGPTWVVLQFERPVQFANGFSLNSVTVTGDDGRRGTITDLSLNYSRLVIGMQDVPDQSVVTLAFPGLQNLAGSPITATLSFGVLVGDVKGDCRVNLGDLVAIRDKLNEKTAVTNLRADVTCDGKINLSDMVIVRDRQYHQVTCPSPGVLSVSEPAGFVSTGYEKGPFTPASMTYTLSNTGGVSIAWTAAITQTWLTLSKTGGTLAPGASDTVEISINAEANNLAVGSYSDTITVTNTTNGLGSTTREISITVNAPPPGMPLIPAGEFLMGNSLDANEGAFDELPRHAVYVDAFYMDKYEVTNQQYADALNWAMSQGNLITVTSGVVYKYNSGTSSPYCSTTAAPGYPDYGEYSRITWNGSTFGVVSGKEDHPMVQVSWYGSVAYANWRSGMQSKPQCYDLATWTCDFNRKGYRLPTEAEWERAARGGVDGHRFAWSDSDTIQHARANYYSHSSFSYDTSPTRGHHWTFNTGEYTYTSPVGYFAPNGYGLYDMAGNVWEWCNDWYERYYYNSSPTNNPRGPMSGSYRVLRSGCWTCNALYCRVAKRNNLHPDVRINDIGFRLALDSE